MPKLLNNERGFTLIETLMSFVILIIGSVSVWGLFIAGSRFNAESEDRTIAANIAQLKMEEIMDTRYGYVLGPNEELIPNPVVTHPPEVKAFKDVDFDNPKRPYWTLDSAGNWITSLPEGKYEIGYPLYIDQDPPITDPLTIEVKISWRSQTDRESSITLSTLLSVVPGPLK